jgi:serine/threonine protein kinase
MWRNESYSLESLGLKGAYKIEDIPAIPIETLPVYNEKTHELMTGTVKRTQFHQETALAHGSYGNLFFTVRNGETVLLKQPRLAEMNLLQEGVLQFLAQKTVEKEGIGWCIPKVFDIFWRQQKIWFSMEYIPGKSVVEWLTQDYKEDSDFFFLIAQICLCLLCLEIHLGLDHRDLKLDNLLIKLVPSTIHIKVKETHWTLHSPFTVVILDFGFACLGSKELRGKPIVNLGDGVLPPMDPCPKEGRDLFQLLTSFLRYPAFTSKITEKTEKQIDDWLSIGKKSYGPMARRWSTENWTYLVVSQRDFAIPSCCPLNILRSLLPELHGHLSWKQL